MHKIEYNKLHKFEIVERKITSTVLTTMVFDRLLRLAHDV